MRRLLLIVAAGCIPVVLAAQIPGQNINMVTGKTFPNGDPWLQKQNEPSVAVSTRNPCTLLAGANDYRAVNVPGLPDDKEIGDAWLGVYKSKNCGQTWFSDLLPGYPQDSSDAGNASPVKGLSTGADPVVRAGPSGFFGYSFIAFNRGSNVGALAFSRFIDHNNRESGDSIAYAGTTIVDNGSSGQFLDKPWMSISRGTGTCTIDGETIPASTIHVVWTVFVGNNDQNIRTKLYYAKSTDCGATFGPASKLSEGYPVNQGATAAIDPTGTNIYVLWRQFATDKTTTAILMATSIDGGKTFTKAEPVPFFNPFAAFDQGTTSKTFRTNAYPSAVVDHAGRLHVVLAVRGFAVNLNQSRAIYTNYTTAGGWSTPVAVDPDPSNGHQIMPALSYAGGRLQVIWYDLRETEAGKAYPSAYESFVREIWPVRHTVDVRGAEGTIASNGTVSFQQYGILQLPSVTVPKVSQYLIGSNGQGLKQFQYNMPNLKLYAGGTVPFLGDYIDVAGLSYVPVRTQGGQQWMLNDGSIPGGNTRTFHAVWTDNRDARATPGLPEPAADGQEGPALGYAAAGTAACVPNSPSAQLTNTRNANVYTSRVTPGLFVAAPGNAKPISCTSCPAGRIQRAYGVYAQNTTGSHRTFRMTIANQPTGGTASFAQHALLTQIDLTIPGKSSAARTVYATSSEKYPAIVVNVVELNVPAGSTPLSSSVLLNPDVANPDVANPDVANPDVANNEVHNPDVANPDVANPDVANPDVANPDVANPDVANPDVANPDVANPDVANPDVANPDVANPDVANATLQNGTVTDVSFDVTNAGNTTSTYQANVTVGGNTNPFLFQLIGRRVYKTPTAANCAIVDTAQNQILFNITNPLVLPGGFPDVNNGSAQNATLLLQPGETVKVTLRVFDKDVLSGAVSGKDGIITPFCALIDPAKGCATATNAVVLTVKAQAANNFNGTIDAAPVSDSSSTTLLPPASFGIATTSLPGGFVNRPFGPEVVEAAGGTAPYTWSVSSGSLPPGVTLNASTGVLGGTPTTAGTYSYTVQVQDALAATDTQAFTTRIMAFQAGDLLVGDGGPATTTGVIHRVTADGSVTEQVAAVSGRPIDMVADSQGRLIVVDSTLRRVLRVTPNHVKTLWSGSPLLNPVGVGLDAAGNIIVADNSTDKMYKLPADGSSISELASLPSTPIELQDVVIALDSNDDVLVADDGGATVTLLRISPAGSVSTILNETAVIQRTSGLVVRGDGNYALADFQQSRISIVSPAGAILSHVTVGSISGMDLDFDGNYVAVSGTTVRRITPAGGSTTIKSGAPFVWLNDVVVNRPEITFESFPDGTPACASCPATNEFASLGVVFSFDPLLDVPVTNAQLVGPTGSDRSSEPGNHSVTFAAAPPPGGGFYTGTVRMTTAANPGVVVFQLRGNDSIENPYTVTARDGNGNAITDITRRNVFTYTGLGSYTSREEIVTVRSPNGVASIDVGSNMGLVLIDRLILK